MKSESCGKAIKLALTLGAVLASGSLVSGVAQQPSTQTAPQQKQTQPQQQAQPQEQPQPQEQVQPQEEPQPQEEVQPEEQAQPEVQPEEQTQSEEPAQPEAQPEQQPQDQSTQSVDSAESGTVTISGKVSSVDENLLVVIDDNGAEQKLKVTPDTRVSKGDAEARVTDLKSDDKVTVSATKESDGSLTAMSIDAVRE